MSERVSSDRSIKRRALRHAKGRASLLRQLGYAVPAAGGILALAAHAAPALQLYDGSTSGNNLEINLDTTLSYSGFYRVQSPSKVLTSGVNNPNGNDGDDNLRHGIVGNVFEVLPVLDIKDNNFGMHFSGEYFVNTTYLGTTQNNQQNTINPILPKGDDFASETREANGLNGRLLDAFVYDTWNVGQQVFTLKAGQQTLLWGQSLFFGTNGIAGGQAPIDAVAATNLVNPQSQQIFLPVGQIVGTYKPNATYTLQGYYQYQWTPYSLNGVGSYFSTSDVTGPGGYRIIADTLGNKNFYLNKIKDLTPPSQNGQFGLSIQAQYGNYDLGLFGERFDAKTPEVATVINESGAAIASGNIGTYQLVYARDIWLGGASVSTTIGATNVAGEVSARTHAPLVSGGATGYVTNGQQPFLGNANSDPLYPTGDTMTGLASFIYGTPALSFDPGGITFLGEVEYVKLLHVTQNAELLAPGRSSSASALDVEATPAYFDVLPNLELQFPVSVSYDYAGNSEVDSTMQHGTGSYALGITATYRQTWDASLNYVGYFGKVSANGLAASVNQSADRGYLTLNLQHTF